MSLELLLEVPEPNPDSGGLPWFVTDVGTNNSIGYYRTAGNLNLNTLRHSSNLAAVLDDPGHLTLGTASLNGTCVDFAH